MEERIVAAGSGSGSGRARCCGFVVWLHGLGDCGRANEFIADHYFTAAAFGDTRWSSSPPRPPPPSHATVRTSYRRRCHNSGDSIDSALQLARRR